MNLFKRSIGLRMVCDLRVLRLYVYKLRSCSRYYFVGALASLDENRMCNPPICSELFSAVYMNVGVTGEFGIQNGQSADVRYGLASGDPLITGDNIVGYFVGFSPRSQSSPSPRRTPTFRHRPRRVGSARIAKEAEGSRSLIKHLIGSDRYGGNSSRRTSVKPKLV